VIISEEESRWAFWGKKERKISKGRRGLLDLRGKRDKRRQTNGDGGRLHQLSITHYYSYNIFVDEDCGVSS
jgi:hypothetical protein